MSSLTWIVLFDFSPEQLEQLKKLTEECGRNKILLAMLELKKLKVMFPNILHIQAGLKGLDYPIRMPLIIEWCKYLEKSGFIKGIRSGSYEAFTLTNLGLKYLGLPDG